MYVSLLIDALSDYWPVVYNSMGDINRYPGAVRLVIDPNTITVQLLETKCVPRYIPFKDCGSFSNPDDY
jgi:hypothetical protein